MAGDTLDKMIGMNIQTLNTAADQNFAQSTVCLLDNSSSNIAKTIRSIFVNVKAYAQATNKATYAMLVVTSEDGVLPNFAGNITALNTALNNYRRLVWTTELTLVKSNAAIDGVNIGSFEPGTQRTLNPGQKLYLVVLAANHGNSTADAIYYCHDYNIWFAY